MNLRISACDDEKIFRDYIEEKSKIYGEENNIEITFNGYDTGAELIKCDERIDLLFLDIELKDCYAMDILEAIRKKDNVDRVVLATSHIEEAVNGYGEKTIGFLSKPFDEDRIKTYIDKARKNKKSLVEFQVSEGVRVEDVAEILYVEAAGNYAKIFTMRGTFLVYKTMKSSEKMLERYGFMRVHKSYLINMSNVEMVEKKEGIIKIKGSSTQIKIGRVYKKNFLEKYEEYRLERARRRLE